MKGTWDKVQAMDGGNLADRLVSIHALASVQMCSFLNSSHTARGISENAQVSMHRDEIFGCCYLVPVLQ